MCIKTMFEPILVQAFPPLTRAVVAVVTLVSPALAAWSRQDRVAFQNVWSNNETRQCR
jgi:hypothetical protein